METSMNSIIRVVAVMAGLALLLHSTPSWSQPVCVSPGCNSTASDVNENTAGGTEALANLSDDASSNTAFGTGALHSTTTGIQNTATGDTAMFKNTTGNQNTASGFQALINNISGSFNTATGVNALSDNTTGTNNTATGANALLLNTTGVNNTATGADALHANETGTLNTATGANALLLNVSGEKNTAVGYNALMNSTGNKNIGIGLQAGTTLTSGNNNIFIGNQGAGAESQTIRVGTAQTRTFIAGINVAGVSGATVVVDGNGQLGVPFSSARYKQDIAPMGGQSEKLFQLQPVTFAYKDDTRNVTHYGLVAEEVAAVYPELVTRTSTGEVQTVKYQELIPMLLNELQRLRQELAELRAQGQGRGAAAETAALAR
jgi:hypothetical protein